VNQRNGRHHGNGRHHVCKLIADSIEECGQLTYLIKNIIGGNTNCVDYH